MTHVPQVLGPRDLALRRAGEQRLVTLRRKSDKLNTHLASARGRNDAQAIFHLLHHIEVEYNDLWHNLQKPEYVPKVGKAKRERALKNVPKPDPPKLVREPKPRGPSKFAIARPVAVASLENMGRGEGRSWCSAPLVEVELPILAKAVLEALHKFAIEDEGVIVRNWAQDTLGSLEAAREALKIGATMTNTPESWRGLITQAKNTSYFDDMSDEALMKDQRAARTARIFHAKEWVNQTLDSIKRSAKGNADLDTLDRRVRGALRSFHTAVNSGKHTNPQFSYLSLEKPVTTLAQVHDEL